MPDNSLEKNINNEMYDWKINPSPAVWAAVEEALDKKKRRYFFAWWWLLPILIGGTVLFPYLNREGDRGADQLAASEIAQTPKALNDTVAERMRSAETILTDGHRKDKVVRKTNIESTAEKNIKARELITDSISSNGFKSAGRRRTINSKERQKISIQAPEIDDAGTEPDEIVEIIHREGLTTKEVDITASNPINDSVVPLANMPDQKVGDLESTITTDTISLKHKQEKKRSITAQWMKALELNIGKTSLINLNAGNQDPAYYSPGGIGSGPANLIRKRIAYQFKPGWYIAAGINITQPITKTISLSTGIQYNLQMLPGEKNIRVDSFATASANYTNLSSSTESAHLTIHSINIPIGLQLSITKRLGVAAGINNNLIVYSNRTEFKPAFSSNTVYFPGLYIQPSYRFKNISAGPFVNLGLKAGQGQRLLNYGLAVKYNLKK